MSAIARGHAGANGMPDAGGALRLEPFAHDLEIRHGGNVASHLRRSVVVPQNRNLPPAKGFQVTAAAP
jgi:hypothetical protein